jgi:hypothetical protein
VVVLGSSIGVVRIASSGIAIFNVAATGFTVTFFGVVLGLVALVVVGLRVVFGGTVFFPGVTGGMGFLGG